MPQFKRTVFRFLRFPSKFRRSLPKRGEVTPAEESFIARGESVCLRRPVLPGLQPILQHPSDTGLGEVVEKEEREDDGIDIDEYQVGEEDDADAEETRESEDDEDVGVEEIKNGKEDSRDEIDAEVKVEAQDAEVEDTPEPMPFELVQKTRVEMIVHHLYVALTDDDAEIAALRTRDSEPFSHVVRIAFDPSSDNDTLAPSNWSRQLHFPDDAPFELRLTCPEFSRRLGEYQLALTKQQILLARKFVMFSLPYRHDDWLDQGLKFPFSVEACEDTRVLIVGPTDRSVDVMAILISYLASLTGASSAKLLNTIRRLDLVHEHWKKCTLGNMAQAVSTH